MYIIKECKNILFYSILLYSSCIERLLSVVLRQRACTDAWNMSPDVSLHLWTLSQHGRQDKAIIMYFLCNYNVMQARAHTHTYMCECLHICKFISVCAQACLRKNDWERVCVCVSGWLRGICLQAATVELVHWPSTDKQCLHTHRQPNTCWTLTAQTSYTCILTLGFSIEEHYDACID